MELIKGKWYKNLGEMQDHIGKFDGWCSLTIMSVSEYIYKGKLRGASVCFTKDYGFAEECPLSEIQQYLPEGHPDKEFVLPEKWFVKCISQEEANTVETYLFGSPINNNYLPKYITNKGICGPGHNSSYYKGWSCKEITFEQFTKYVLKKDNMEKEIIGYKCPVDLFNGNIKKDWILFKDSDGNTYRPKGQGPLHALPKEIVETWEPVYKEEYPNITINGYKGEFFNDYVKFGCAEIDKRTFIGLNHLVDDNKSIMKSNREIESVTIGKGTFTKEQIKLIADHYLNKK